MEEEKKLWWHYGSANLQERKAIMKAFEDKGVNTKNIGFGSIDMMYFGATDGNITCIPYASEATRAMMAKLLKTVSFELPIHIEPEHKVFKAYDKVIVRSDGKWVADLYSHWSEERGHHVTLCGLEWEDGDILPYSGNEDEVGKEVEDEKNIEDANSPWVSMKDQLPKKGVICLFHMKDGGIITTGYIDKNNQLWSRVSTFKVTLNPISLADYWMSIPKLPKE